MKIGFDIRPFLSGETGVGVYFKNLLNAMSKLERDDVFYLLSSSFKERFPSELIPDFKNRKFKDLRIPVSVLNLLWFRFSFPPLGIFFGEKLDLIHSPNPLIIPGIGKKIITIHDISFIDTPELASLEATKYFSNKIEKSIKKADGVIAVSHFTRSRIGNIFGGKAADKVTVIYHGSEIDEIIEEKPLFTIPKNYFLFVGTVEPRKNLSTLIKGFSLIKEKNVGMKLILAGREGTRSSEILRLISDLKLEKDIITTGYIKREELKFLFKNAIALVFPSHYEGFGLPVLEAASLGIPSLVSDIEVFREIFKDYPLYFEKDNPKSLCNTMNLIISNKKLRNKKKVEAIETGKKFSWEKSAKETLSLYDKIGK